MRKRLLMPAQVRWRNLRIKDLTGVKTIKAAVVTGGHGYEEKAFNAMFDGMDIELG